MKQGHDVSRIAGNSTPDRWYARDRLGGLRRFAIAITVLNVLGHTWFGFEQSWAQPLVALATAYSVELFLEWIDAWQRGNRPRFWGGIRQFVEFLMPAHISGLAVAMLIYPGVLLMLIAFAAATAVASKSVFRVTIQGRGRHLYNPSNLGIVLTLLLFPSVGIAPPYMFTENLTGFGNFVLPAIIICSGTYLNTRFTRRLPLIVAWLSTFALQAVARSFLFDTNVLAGWMPMTGMAFILFTFYMVTDPPTTPSTTKGQIAFGISVGVVYCLLMIFQIVFGLFFSLALVSTGRGLYLFARSRLPGMSDGAAEPQRIPATATPSTVEAHANPSRPTAAVMGPDR